jgi:hypothetical protein
VKKYGKIATPLTSLLKKNAFVWSEVAARSFATLKDSMCTTLVLAVPKFKNTFFLECDASGKGLKVLLMQEGCPLAFTSEKLCDCNLEKPTYEKEMMAILHGVETWCPYLIGKHFQIKTGHHNRNYFLEQGFSSPKKHKWVTKMLGCDYEIMYKKGKRNVVIDALSRKFEEDRSLFSLLLPSP